jgi:hypothetical protein
MASSQARAAVRRALHAADHRMRSVQASARVLPDFMVIGAQKAGTTSLYAYLSTHPDILPAAHKEIHYFDVHYAEGERWYRAMFPTRRRIDAAGQPDGRRVVTGEASPYYLFHPLAARRAADTVPDARLVVLLRDPIERAWSHYRHEVRAGRERLSFVDALAAEPTRLSGAEAALRAGLANAATVAHRTSSYIARGRYAQQLRRWLEHYPRESLLVVQAEDLFDAPVREFGRVVEHLGVAQMREPRFDVFNAGRRTPIDPDARADLTEVFREPNAELEELLGVRLPWPTRAA